ncbi:MAG TPA: fused MFS/spermidine synthase [Solirubrobacteraceae bacterium]|nr:fused MFS/spermidine synthase [Solirubrobacteraceae bacterium]
MPPLRLLVFVVGASSLGAEIAAARLLAPYFGASTIVWANTIATVLVALSIGYWVGGRMADRDPSKRRLCLIVLAAGALLAAVPFVAGPFLGASADAFDSLSAGAFLGSLLGVLVLVAVPVLLLGAVAPFAVRLSVQAVEESGRVAGRLYAISTAGSLVGTFLSALLLIPLVGTRRTFLAFALALALVAALGLGRRFLLAPVALGALIALPVGTVKAAEGARVLAEADTQYQYARVVQEPDGERVLELNEGQAVHSAYRRETVLTGGYWDEFLVAPFSTRRRAPRRIAVLGNAAGTTARAYGRFFPATVVDGVEIDGELSALGRRWFAMRAPRLRVHTADARPFLRASDDRFDGIFVDAYRQPYIPFYLVTREFFTLARDRLAPGGVLAVNVGHPEGSDRLEKVLTATMRAAGLTVWRDPVTGTNSVVMAARGPLGPAVLRAAAPRLAPALRPVAELAAGRLAPGLRGGEVYTDDHAPVEWLVDVSLARYAAGNR